jgi:Fe-S-cluster containining protein
LNPNKKESSKEKTVLPHFECTKCGACCRDESLLVTVTGSDIVRIAYALGLKSNDMLKAVDFYILSAGLPTPIGLEQIPSVKTEMGPAYIALKKMENGDCIFLKDDLCMIHPARPVVCRSFPFTFIDSDGRWSWGLSAKREICPGLGTGPLVSINEIEELAETILPEMQIYKEFTDEWNTNQKSPTAAKILEMIFEDPRFYI